MPKADEPTDGRSAGLAGGAQWRKYTGGAEPRTMGQHMHFYFAALLPLDDAQLNRIFGCTREHGATVEAGARLVLSSTPIAE